MRKGDGQRSILTNIPIHYSINHFHTSHFVDPHSCRQVVVESEYRRNRTWIGSRCRRRNRSSHYIEDGAGFDQQPGVNERRAEERPQAASYHQPN